MALSYHLSPLVLCIISFPQLNLILKNSSCVYFMVSSFFFLHCCQIWTYPLNPAICRIVYFHEKCFYLVIILLGKKRMHNELLDQDDRRCDVVSTCTTQHLPDAKKRDINSDKDHRCHRLDMGQSKNSKTLMHPICLPALVLVLISYLPLIFQTTACLPHCGTPCISSLYAWSFLYPDIYIHSFLSPGSR